MFSESEVDIKTDFVPKKQWDDNFFEFCKKYCRNYETCPCFYQCTTMARWDMADVREL